MNKNLSFLIAAFASTALVSACATQSELPQQVYSMSVLDHAPAAPEQLDFRLTNGYVVLLPGSNGTIRVDNVTIVNAEANCQLTASSPVSVTAPQAIQLFSISDASQCIPEIQSARAIGVTEVVPQGSSSRADQAFKVNYSTAERNHELMISVPVYY